MQKFIITTPEELDGLIQNSVLNALRSQEQTHQKQQREYLTLKQASVFLDLAPQTIYGLTSKGRIPYLKSGKKLLFLKTALEAWLLEDNRQVNERHEAIRKELNQ